MKHVTALVRPFFAYLSRVHHHERLPSLPSIGEASNRHASLHPRRFCARIKQTARRLHYTVLDPPSPVTFWPVQSGKGKND